MTDTNAGLGKYSLNLYCILDRKQDNAQLHLRTCGKDTLEAENVRLCWVRMHQALGLIPVPHEPDVMAHACNPSTQAGGYMGISSLRLSLVTYQGQPGRHEMWLKTL